MTVGSPGCFFREKMAVVKGKKNKDHDDTPCLMAIVFSLYYSYMHLDVSIVIQKIMIDGFMGIHVQTNYTVYGAGLGGKLDAESINKSFGPKYQLYVLIPPLNVLSL